jgi:hypothetical protein
VAGAALMLAVSVTAVTVAAAMQPGQPRLTVIGVAQDPCQQQRALPVPARLGGHFEPDSSILLTGTGTYAAPRWPAPPARTQSACAAAAERAGRDWLRAGCVPGATTAQRSMATRALLDLREVSVQVTLGTAAPLLAGLRAAADLAADIGGATATSDGRRWSAAAARLAAAITATFGQTGYQRNPDAGSGADAAVTFLGPPFADPGPEVLQAARSAQRALTVPDGGLRPGVTWPGTPGLDWTAETAFFALFNAATGQHGQAAALLDWLAAHRTQLGSLPEQVNSAGKPAWIAPLSWTDAVTLLALLAQARHLPTVPVPPPRQQSSSHRPELRRLK